MVPTDITCPLDPLLNTRFSVEMSSLLWPPFDPTGLPAFAGRSMPAARPAASCSATLSACAFFDAPASDVLRVDELPPLSCLFFSLPLRGHLDRASTSAMSRRWARWARSDAALCFALSNDRSLVLARDALILQRLLELGQAPHLGVARRVVDLRGLGVLLHGLLCRLVALHVPTGRPRSEAKCRVICCMLESVQRHQSLWRRESRLTKSTSKPSFYTPTLLPSLPHHPPP